MSIIVLDTETNGLPTMNSNREMCNPQKYSYYNTARMIELGYIVYKKNIDDGWYIDKTVSTLISPDEFKIENDHIHGITLKEAQENGKPIQQVLDEFKSDLINSKYIVGHNIKFDINIILAETYRYENKELAKIIKSKKHLCTMMMGKKKFTLRKYPKLIELYTRLFDKKFDKEPHRALHDAEACGECFHKMLEKKN